MEQNNTNNTFLWQSSESSIKTTSITSNVLDIFLDIHADGNSARNKSILEIRKLLKTFSSFQDLFDQYAGFKQMC
jgi:vacuolar-type H+-ATPase catalytic subunit A/Vma1